MLFPRISSIYHPVSILKPRSWKSDAVIHLYAWLNPLSHRKVFLPYEPFYISKLLPLPMKIIACSSFRLYIMKIQFPFPLSFYLFFNPVCYKACSLVLCHTCFLCSTFSIFCPMDILLSNTLYRRR